MKNYPIPLARLAIVSNGYSTCYVLKGFHIGGGIVQEILEWSDHFMVYNDLERREVIAEVSKLMPVSRDYFMDKKEES